MADAFYGEIRAFGFNYVPPDWLPCDGQLLPVGQYQALFALIGNTYGGTYPSTFALPNLNGSVAIGMGLGPDLPYYTIGDSGGTVSTTLTPADIPYHTHGAVFVPADATNSQVSVAVSTSSASTNQSSPSGNILSPGLVPTGRVQTPFNTFAPSSQAGATALGGVTVSGGMVSGSVAVGPSGIPSPQPLSTLAPVLPLVFAICINGEWPPKPE